MARITLEKLEAAYRQLYIAARMVCNELKRSPGGDQYTFEGSTNLVDNLENELERAVAEDDLSAVAYAERDR